MYSTELVIICLINILSGAICAEFGIMFYQLRYYLIALSVIALSIFVAPYIASAVNIVLHNE
jgi:hypothetical protein